MPLILPDRLPAIEFLKDENIFVLGDERAHKQDIRPLRIVILNLMPLKITTETDLMRILSNTPLQMEIHLMKVKAHTSKNTPVEHMRAFYRDFELMSNEKFDGMIITGAPVEHLDFKDVTYWDEISNIFSWARTHVTSTLYICWAAQAALYSYYGIPKYPLPQKMFGIFPQLPLAPKLPIFRGFDDVFYMPHSRHTEIRREDILKVPDLNLIAERYLLQDTLSMPPIHSIRNISVIWQRDFPSRSHTITIRMMTLNRGHSSLGVLMEICCSPTGSTITFIRRLLTILTIFIECNRVTFSCQKSGMRHRGHRPWC